MKLTKRYKEAVAVTALLVVLAVICRVLGNNGFHPRTVGLIRSGIYISLFAAWGFSLQTRIMQIWQRRYMVSIAACMSFGFLLRTLKYHITVDGAVPDVRRLIWYAYYISMLLIPMLSLFAAVSLGKPEQYRPPRLLHLLWAPTILLIITVLTNDLHQTVFVFPKEYPIWTDDHYFYGPMYGVTMPKQFARMFNTTEHTIRYYTDIGLLTCQRDKGDRRVFNEESVNWMQGITWARQLSITLPPPSQRSSVRSVGSKSFDRIGCTGPGIAWPFSDFIDCHKAPFYPFSQDRTSSHFNTCWMYSSQKYQSCTPSPSS